MQSVLRSYMQLHIDRRVSTFAFSVEFSVEDFRRSKANEEFRLLHLQKIDVKVRRLRHG